MKRVSVRVAPCAAAASLAAALFAAGCGDGHDYPKGFADKAALDEKGYLAAEAAKAKKTADAPATKQAAVAAPAPAPTPTPAPAAPPASEAAAVDTASSEETVAAAEPAEESAPGAGDSPARRRIVDSVVAELALPAPRPVPPADGEAPYQKHARDRKFDEFRNKAARYVQLKKQLLPLGKKLAEGVATPAERALHNRLEEAIAIEFKPLNRYLWDERWSESDRAAMGWILFVKPD